MSNRMLRDCTDSEKVNTLTAPAEVLFYRLMMKADDYGSFHGNPKLVKASCYPLRLDSTRETDISRWMDELLKAGLIVVYTDAGKQYLRIINFRQRLRNKNKRFPECPEDILTNGGELQQVAADGGELRPEVEVEDEVELEEELKNNRAKALAGKPAVKRFDSEDTVLKNEFKALVIPETPMEAWPIIKAWITDKAPQFIDPYVVAWNVFATVYRLPSVSKINDSRRRKFSVRVKEDGFEFIAILAKARESNLLRESSWFTFDWIIENDKNYLKVLEGNYK